MKTIKQISTLVAILAYLGFSSGANACNYSYLTLNSVVNNGDGTYDNHLTFCVGSGRSSSQYGADQNTFWFKFQLTGASFAATNPYPLTLTSPSTGAVYEVAFEEGFPTATELIYWDNNSNQWWACIDWTCGPLGSTCVNLTLRTNGLATSIQAIGAEAGGNLAWNAGCNENPDMWVHPAGCNNLNVNAGADVTVYNGYAPSCRTLTATTSGGYGSYTYLWSNGATTPSITVCPTATTTYTVTVTDGLKCTHSDQVVVTYMDVRCGNGLTKVNVCHSGQTRCVTQAQVASHLAHGDQLGSCGSNKSDGFTEVPEPMSMYPNPATDNVHFSIYSETTGAASLEIFSSNGAKIKTLFQGELEGENSAEFELNLSDFAPGIYLVKYSGPENLNKIEKLVVIR